MDSLIPADNIIMLWTALFGITAFSLWAEQKKFGKFLGAAGNPKRGAEWTKLLKNRQFLFRHVHPF